MTITTEVRIMWPVPALALLDHVTILAGGDPATVRRHEEPGRIYNGAAQGLRTLAAVEWSEAPMAGDEEWPMPPALVVLSIDNPYGFGADENRGRWLQANEFLPAIVDWLDGQGVPREAWWWEDGSAGSYHPGTEDVRKLDREGERETWVAA